MSRSIDDAHDAGTAQAFSTSWNNLPEGSVYTTDQHADWMGPLGEADIRGQEVLELGCGNASLLFHTAAWHPSRLVGVDLGDSVISARGNMAGSGFHDWEIVQADLTRYESTGFDVAYCIGVLHHLKSPQLGFDAVVRNVKPGGRFHCWVYAREGNLVVRMLVEPIRRVACHLPWWFNKYLLATPLVVPYYVYAKALKWLVRGGDPQASILRHLPLFEYSLWIARRDFLFFRHVAFDQLVTPQTAYISREQIEQWFARNPAVDPASTYVIARNGNSWKFGGRVA
jgi:ubiquinone/menaquinone biosynthesis C-methylase UbiE